MEVKKVPFTELLSKIVDNRGRTCPTEDGGFPLIATNCVRNDLLYPAFEKVRYVSDDTYKRWFRGHPVPGDLIFVCKGTPGRVCITPDPVSFCIAQDMVAVRADPKKVYPKYLFAVLRSAQVQTQIGNMHVGTLIPHFKKGDFDKLLLPVPDRKTQEVIGDTYFEFSAKIELNRRMNATLEAMARALFQSWFVDFDPVHAKAAGIPPSGMDPATAALFPDAFQDSELGPIPKGWRYLQAQDVADIGIGKTPPRKEPEWFSERNGDVPWVSIRDMGCSGVYVQQTSEFLTSDAVSKFNVRQIQADTVLLSFKLTIGRVVISGMPLTTNEAIAHFNLLPSVGVSREFLYLYLGQFNFSSLGSTSSIATAVNSATIRHMPILVPSKEVIKAFSEKVSPLFEKIKANQSESLSLGEVRDALLPNLLSGGVNALKTV